MKALVLALLLSLVSSRALAQEVPAPPLPDSNVTANAATTGTTDLAPTSFANSGGAKDEEEQNATEASVAAGGLFASGNAQTVALTSSGKLRIRREEQQFSAAAAANFARAAKMDEASAQTTVENYQGLGRYEYFLTPRVSLFAQGVVRRDRFQGLAFRLDADPGVAYHFIQTKNQRLVGELGYDMQYDLRYADIAGDRTRVLHDARGFLGYENKLYEEVSFVASLEHIQNFGDLHLYRLVFDTGLKSTIHGKLAVATTFTLRYENRPLPTFKQSDALASIALVYTFF